MFTCSISDTSPTAIQSTNGCNVEDDSTPLCAEQLDSLAGCMDNRFDIDIKNPVPHIISNIGDTTHVIHDTGIVYKNIQMAELLHSGINHTFCLSLYTNICTKGNNSPWQTLCIFDKLSQTFFTPSYRQNVCAFLGIVPGNVTSHARTGSRYYCYFSF